MISKIKKFIQPNMILMLKNLTKYNLSLMNAGVVYFGYAYTATCFNPLMGTSLFLGNTLMAMAS